MKNLLYLILAFVALACNKENPETPQEEVVELLCEDNDYEFFIEVNGISLSVENCWLVYSPDSNIVFPEGAPAVVKWELPGFPEWNGANSFTFIYNEDDIESGMTYDASSIIGVVAFDGSGGEMLQGLGDESVTFTIDEFNPANDYICGSFEGKALFTDYEVVEIEGSFKGRINP